jgi:hypothetical protein
MARIIGLFAAVLFVAAAARADDPAAAAPAATDSSATPPAPPAPDAPPATPPAVPAPVPAVEHKDAVCGLAGIHSNLVAAEKAIKAAAPYHHAAGHDRQALALISHAMKQLNHGCQAYKHDLKKKAGKK